MKVPTTMQSDLELDVFDRLRFKRVQAQDDQTAFLAQFHSTAASLEPDERIELVVYAYKSSMEFLKAVLDDPQASRICSLRWEYDGEEDVNSVLPLITSNCPELASLEVRFGRHFAFDFVSSMLEHPSNKIKVLEMPGYPEGDSARFFAALGQSQVSALALNHSPKSVQGLHEYLAKDLLVRLEVRMGKKQLLSEMMSLSKCTRLAKLEMLYCEFSQSTVFTLPKSITKLALYSCTFVGDFDWSFLADSNVRELDFRGSGSGVDGNQLGGALAVHLRAKGLDELRFSRCDFVDETLAAIGLGVGRIKRLEITKSANDASIELIALALECPNNELRELVLWHKNNMASDIKNHFVPALKHPNCNLAKLSLSTYGAKVEEDFHNRLALFVLLRGQQARRRYCPLRRLPVEMLRLVGMALI